MIVTGHTVVETGYSDMEYLIVPFSVKVSVLVAMMVLVVYDVVVGTAFTGVDSIGQIVVEIGYTEVVVCLTPSLVIVRVVVLYIVLVV
jgi:hypothetical protein